MANYRNKMGISEEFLIERHQNGVMLIKPCAKNNSGNPLILQNQISDLMKLPFNTYFTSPASTLEFCNEATLMCLDGVRMKDIIGKSVQNFPISSESATKVISNDHDVLRHNAPKFVEEFVEHKVLKSASSRFLSMKFPLYNDRNEIMGIFGFALKLDFNHISQFAEDMSLLSKTGLLSNPINTQANNLNHLLTFTPQERLILDHLIKGLTAKDIARRLNISYRTVEKHLENCRYKTNSTSKLELIKRLKTLVPY